jgi:hypothetical protein
MVDEKGELPYYAWPGGYPIFYITKDNGVLCPKCANMALKEKLTGDKDDPQWYIIAMDVNWESEDLYCDHCNEHIISAYGNDE